MPLADFHRSSRAAGYQANCKTCNATTQKGKKRKPQGVVRALLNSARQRSRERGLPFELTPDDVVIPATCPVLGIPLAARHGRFGGSDNSPSIDRIRNEGGYVPGNVVIVSWRANRIKSDASPEELRRVAAFYGDFHVA